MLFTCPADSARGGSKPTARGKRRHLCVDVHCHVHYLPAEDATDDQQRVSEAVAALLVVQERRLNFTRQQFPQQKACAMGDAARLAAPAFPITSWRACRG